MQRLSIERKSNIGHESKTDFQVPSDNVSSGSETLQYRPDHTSIHQRDTNDAESWSQLDEKQVSPKATDSIPVSSLRPKDWWMEILACAVILLSLLAICLAVGLHANKPLPQWPYGLSVNAVVAIFTTMLRAAMFVVLSEGVLMMTHQEACLLGFAHRSRLKSAQVDLGSSSNSFT